MIRITPEIEELFLGIIKKHLTQGCITESSTTTKTQRKTSYVNVGESKPEYLPFQKDVTYHETSTVTVKPLPSWLLQLVSNSLSTDYAVELLTKQGYEVIDPTRKSENKEIKGLSSENVNAIRRDILGIE